MLEHLQARQGKNIVIELVNGKKISGKVLSVDQQYVRVETDEGVGIISLHAVYIVWEMSRSLTEENMDQLAGLMRDSLKAQIACTGAEFNCRQQYICRPPDICTNFFACPGSYVPFQGGSQCPVAFTCGAVQGFYGTVGPMEGGGTLAGQKGEDVKAQISCTAFPGFTCSQRYVCRPPDNCTFNFACPGSYVPSFPSGGGGCPLFSCGPFQFQQPCGPFQFQQPCGPFQFQQPCRPFQFQQPCGPFQFQQPCGPFQFGQPCVPFPFQQPCRPFQFQQPCGPFQFQQPCRPFQFQQPCVPFPFGSQCTTPGGFICSGQQFAGLVGPTPGPITGPGPMPGIKLPPTSMGVNSEDQNSSPEDKE